MGFLSKLFGKGKAQEGKSRDFIEVPNKWGVGDSSMPLLVERHPDLESIFSNPYPQPPQPLTEQNRRYFEVGDIRYDLAMAYLAHPDPQVRVSTIRLVKDFHEVGIRQVLVDLLADPSNDVKSAAAEVIWSRAKSPDPDENSVAFSIRCLRDEIQGGYSRRMSPSEALEALDVLRKFRPERGDDFNKWLIYAWCRSDEDLAEYGYKLLDIYVQHGTFLGVAREASRQVGVKIDQMGGFEAMVATNEAIQLALRGSAYRELEAVWNGIGRWQY